MRRSLLVTATMLTAALVVCCSHAENKNAKPEPTAAPTQTAAATASTSASPTTTPFVSNSAVVSNAAPPPVSRVKSVPPEGGDRPTEAEFNGYPYSYKTDGEKT